MPISHYKYNYSYGALLKVQDVLFNNVTLSVFIEKIYLKFIQVFEHITKRLEARPKIRCTSGLIFNSFLDG